MAENLLELYRSYIVLVGYRSGQPGQTVNLLANAFDGSNPSPTTIQSMELTRAITEAKETPAAYVLANAVGDYLYKGATRNLKERLKDHAAGRVSRTKNRRPLYLVYMGYCNTYSEALKRERYFKSGPGRIWLKQVV